MADTPTSGPDPDDRVIDEALREMGQRALEPEERPSRDAVLAYLHGTADERQRKEIQRALAASREFREELAALARSFEEIERPAADEHDRAAHPDTVSPQIAHDARRGRMAWPRAIWIPVAAAAAVALLLLTQVGRWRTPPEDPPLIEWGLVESALPPSTFEPMVLRRAEVEPAPHPEAIGAAVESFRTRIEWRDGRLVLLDEVSSAPDPDERVSEGAGTSMLISVLDLDGRPHRILQSAVPAEHQPVQAWLMTYPGLDLYSAPLGADTLGMPMADLPSDGLVVVTITHRGPRGYRASKPHLLSPE